MDLGDGVLCVEFHSKMNAIGGDTLEMLRAGVTEAERNHAALVVGNDAPNFSAGANLMLLLLEAQEGNWDEIDLMIRSFQRATTGLRYRTGPRRRRAGGPDARRRVRGDAARGAGAGGGRELHRARRGRGRASMPAGAGTKEMLARAVESLAPGADLLPAVQRVFETIGFGKVSTSAPDAVAIGYLRPGDGITMNRERLIADAKARALRARAGGLSARRAANRHPGGR